MKIQTGLAGNIFSSQTFILMFFTGLFSLANITTSMAQDSSDKVFHIDSVDVEPRFPECEKIKQKKKRERCRNDKMFYFIYTHIHYPEEASKTGTEGNVVLSFIIEKDGRVSHVEIIEPLGSGCDEEAVRVIKSLPQLIPAQKDGKPVRVRYEIAVKFRLQF